MAALPSCLRLDLGKGPVEVPIAVTLPATGHPPCLGVLLTHGASGNLSSGALPALAERVAAVGAACVRFTCLGPLPRRVRAMEGVLAEVRRLPACTGVERWVLAGHSMGGRVACQLAHDSPGAAAACLLLSYPLHPPQKPAQLRDAPVVDLALPLLLVRGTRDPFSRQPQWDAFLPRLASPQLSVHLVEGGDHGLKVPGGEEACGAALEGALTAAQAFLAQVAQGPADAAAGAERPAESAAAAAAEVDAEGVGQQRMKRGSRKRPR